MKWHNPMVFILVLLIPGAMVGFYLFTGILKSKVLRQFCDPEMQRILLARISPGRQIWRKGFLVLGVFFGLVALCRPQLGFQWEEVKRKGVDILVAVDVSKSMLAADVEPNRLERAKRELTDLLSQLQGDRIGLIAFAGTPYLQCPLTLDYGAVSLFLDYLSPDLVDAPGTNVMDTITLATATFQKQSSPSRALILITDGEDLGGAPLEAAKAAKEAGVKIFAIGIGQEEGAPIPAESGGGFRKDRYGNVILTKLDEKTLQAIALETGGIYVRSVAGDMDLEKVYHEGIRQEMETVELKSGKRQRFEERFQWPLAVGILFILFELLIPEGKRISSSGLILWVLVGVITFLTPGSSFATSNPAKLYEKKKYKESLEGFLQEQVNNPKDLRLQYNIGNNHYRLGQWEEAARSFADVAASEDPNLAWQAFYNLGNTAYQQGKLEAAISSYERALALRPEDEDTKHNLEFVREELKRRSNEAIQNPPPEQKEKPQEDEASSSENNQKNQDSRKEQGEKPESESPAGAQEALSKAQAEGILSNLQEGHRKSSENEKKQPGILSRRPGDKDW